MAHPLRSTRRLVPIVMMACALVGCGSDDPATTDSSASPSEASPSTESSSVPTSVVVSTTTATVDADVADDAIVVQAPSPEGDGIFLLSDDGTVGRRLDPGTSSAKHPDWSPDGAAVIFVDDSDGSLWTAGVDGSPAQQLLACDHGCLALDFPAYSPDGQRVAYTRYEPPAGDGPPSASSILVLDLATGQSTEAARSEQPELVDVPRWSPDGTQLVIGIDQFDVAFDEAGSTIGVVSAEGGEIRRLVDTSTYAYAPDWGEAGIVFSVETVQFRGTPQPGDDTWNLFLVQPDGSGLRTITDRAPGEQLFQPAWSPDGASILATLQSASGGSRTIVSVEPATGAVTPISTELATHPKQRRSGST